MHKWEGKQNLYPQEMALQIQKSVDQSFPEQELRSLGLIYNGFLFYK